MKDGCEAISKFQYAYKAVKGCGLRAENIVLPASITNEEVRVQINKFEQAYPYCVFVLDEERCQIRVVSHTRQFEEVKQFLIDTLQTSVASAAKGDSKATTNSMVTTLANDRKLTLKRGDMVIETAGILVNAANGRLVHDGGLAGALNALSEGELQKQCNRYMEHTQKGVEVRRQ